MSNATASELKKDQLISSMMDVLIKEAYLHPCKLEIVFRDLTDWARECILDQVNYGQEDETFLKTFDWDTVAYTQKILEVRGLVTGNTDNRGGGCGNFKIPLKEWHWKVLTPNGITLRNLTEGVHRMKGSKYDYWYELYGGFKVVERTNEKLIIEVDFDYGS